MASTLAIELRVQGICMTFALADQVEARALALPGIDPSARSRSESLMTRKVDAGLERIARFALLVS